MSSASVSGGKLCCLGSGEQPPHLSSTCIEAGDEGNGCQVCQHEANLQSWAPWGAKCKDSEVQRDFAVECRGMAWAVAGEALSRVSAAWSSKREAWRSSRSSIRFEGPQATLISLNISQHYFGVIVCNCHVRHAFHSQVKDTSVDTTGHGTRSAALIAPVNQLQDEKHLWLSATILNCQYMASTGHVADT